MNLAQKIVLMIGCLALIGLSLWVPVARVSTDGYTMQIVWLFIFQDGISFNFLNLNSIAIYVLEIVICLAVTGFFYAAFAGTRRN